MGGERLTEVVEGTQHLEALQPLGVPDFRIRWEQNTNLILFLNCGEEEENGTLKVRCRDALNG